MAPFFFRRFEPTTWIALAAFGLSGCFVPQNRYDDVVAKLRTEEAARRNAEQQIAEARFDLGRIDQVLRQREQSLATYQGAVAQSKIDVQQASTERDDAVALVEQLRGELGRVGDNLKEFSDKKHELEAALSDAEARAKRVEALERASDEMVLVVRDVSVALGDAIAKGRADLSAKDGKLVVRFEAERAFSTGTADLSPEGGKWFERVGSALCLHEDARVEVADRSTAGASAEARTARAQSVALALVKKGVSKDAIAVPNADAPSAQSATDPAGAGTAPDEDASGSFVDGPGSVEITVAVTPAK